MARKVRLDNKVARCPNSQLLGFSTTRSKNGLWVQFQDSCGNTQLGIVLGRIAELYDGLEDCRGWVCVETLSMDGTFWMERWVNPKDVLALLPVPAHINRPIDKNPNKALETLRKIWE